MPYIGKIRISNNDYDLRDTLAHQRLDTLENASHFIGVGTASPAIEDGQPYSGTITIGGSAITLKNGDVFIIDNGESDIGTEYIAYVDGNTTILYKLGDPSIETHGAFASANTIQFDVAGNATLSNAKVINGTSSTTTISILDGNAIADVELSGGSPVTTTSKSVVTNVAAAASDTTFCVASYISGNDEVGTLSLQPLTFAEAFTISSDNVNVVTSVGSFPTLDKTPANFEDIDVVTSSNITTASISFVGSTITLSSSNITG